MGNICVPDLEGGRLCDELSVAKNKEAGVRRRVVVTGSAIKFDKLDSDALEETVLVYIERREMDEFRIDKATRRGDGPACQDLVGQPPRNNIDSCAL